MFSELQAINARPKPFQFYTASELWTDPHTSERMLEFHLNGAVDVSSRRTAFIDQSVEWIVSRFGVGPGTRVADLGCGPGLYTTRLARAGADVTGIDFSERSIRHAREVTAREGLSVRYVNENYLDFRTDDRLDLILMIMCDFCALSPAQRKRLLARFGAFLAPGGTVLLDVYSLAAFDQREEAATYGPDLLDGFWSPNPYYGFLNTFKYDREKVVLDRYTLIEPGRTRTVYNWLQHFSPESLEREFADCGFEVAEFLGDVAGAPYDSEAHEFAVVAKKPR